MEVLQLPHVTLFDPIKKKSTHDLVSDILRQGPSETGSVDLVSPSSPSKVVGKHLVTMPMAQEQFQEAWASSGSSSLVS